MLNNSLAVEKEEKAAEDRARENRKNALNITNIASAQMGGPPCKKCLVSWKLHALVTPYKQKRNELKKELAKLEVKIKKFEKADKYVMDNHTKCSKCGIVWWFALCYSNKSWRNIRLRSLRALAE